MRISTTTNPLIANMMVPKKPQVVSASDVRIIYDPHTQTTIYMGGKSGPSRSSDGWKETWEPPKQRQNDAERWTDD